MEKSTVHFLILIVCMLFLGAGLAVWGVQAGFTVPVMLEDIISPYINNENIDEVKCNSGEKIQEVNGEKRCVEEDSLDLYVKDNVFIPKANLDLVSEMEADWTNTYSGGSFFNEYNFMSGTGSLTITAGDNGQWYGARLRRDETDWSNKALYLNVMLSDWEKMDTFLLLVSTDNGAFENYYTFNFRRFLNKPEENQWIELVLNRSDFEATAGSPDWSKVSDIMIRLSAVENATTSVSLDKFAVFDQAPDGIISLAFDGGYSEVLEAKTILDKYDYPATSYIDPDKINQPSYLTQTQVDFLHKEGWDISGFYSEDLRDNPENATKVFERVRTYLLDNNYRGADHFAFPNGGYTADLQQKSSKYFLSARTSDGLYQSLHYINPQQLQAKVIWPDTPTSQVTKWVDDAIAENVWLILVWHKVVQNIAEDFDYSIHDFNQIINHIQQTGVIVEPVSEVINPRIKPILP